MIRQLIARNEFTQALRDRRFVVTGGVVLLFVAAWTGFRNYRFGLVENLNNEMKTSSKTGDWNKKVSTDFWAKTPDFTYQLPSVGWALDRHSLSGLALLLFGGALFWIIRRGLKTVTIA